jgi:hypothetical protein
MRQLERNYINAPARDMAISLWERRAAQGKYGSVAFHCYNHLLKADPDKKSKRASVMGPCIQSVVLTLLKKGEIEVDIFYRTTEVLKKFPADLVFIRDVLLKPFNLPPDVTINFFFSNLTVHPMYFVTIIPMRDDPIEDLEDLRIDDPYYYKWVVKWTARYLCDEFGRGIDKFAQACRVRDTSGALVLKPKKLQKYLRKHHPGFRK